MPALKGQQAIDYLKEHGSYASLQEAITATQYRIVPVPQDAGMAMPNETYRAPNPRQWYQTRFTPVALLASWSAPTTIVSPEIATE